MTNLTRNLLKAGKLALFALPLAACAGTPRVDVCKGAELRRTTYTTTINVADAWELSPRPVPASVVLAREAAVTALRVLNGNCPRP